MRPRLFVELCAGSAAVSLRLVGGPNANPPIGYMGGKRGYARAILGVLGLRQGLGAQEVWLNDAGPWGPVWRVLTTPGKAEEVAAIIRGWKDEEPRALWDRLKAEGWGELTEAGEVAAAVLLQGNAASGVPVFYREGFGLVGYAGYGKERLSAVGRKGDMADGRTVGIVDMPALASRVEAVARWLVCGAWAYRQGNPDSGFQPRISDGCGSSGCNAGNPETAANVARRAERAHSLTATHCRAFHGSALDVPIPDDCEEVFMYLDPPYQGCTGYAADMPREDVIATAIRWSDAGAVVCISEAMPIELPGWHHVEITSERKGQKRTFSKQKREWLTLNLVPLWRPPHQPSLFGDQA